MTEIDKDQTETTSENESLHGSGWGDRPADMPDAKDAVIFGSEIWTTLYGLHNAAQGYGEEVRAFEIVGIGCVVNTHRRLVDPNGESAVSESSVFVPMAKIGTGRDGSRRLIPVR